MSLAMEIIFTEEELQKVEAIKSRYPQSQSALMPTLWMAQKKFGYLSQEVQTYVAEILDLPVSHVNGVASFYTMYFKKQMGKHHIQCCTNVSCMLRDGDKIYELISNKLGIGHNEVTPDGNISLEEVECMGACGGAPMIAINEDFIENVDINRIDDIIDSLK